MPSTGFLRFNAVQGVSGVSSTEAATLLSLGAGGSNPGSATISDVNDEVRLKGITHSVPSNATIVGIEMRIVVRTNGTGTTAFSLRPAIFDTTTTLGNSANVGGTGGASTYTYTSGTSSTMFGLTMSGADVDNIGLLIRTTGNASALAIQLRGQESGPGGLSGPAINVHYTLPTSGTIERWNDIPINSTVANTVSTVLTSSNTLGTFTFAGQVRQTATSHTDTGGWNPSDPNTVGLLNMSGWANGADASANFNWKGSTNNATPSIRANEEAADWFMGPNTTSSSSGTASSGTGPPSGVDVDNLPSSLPASTAVDNPTRFLYSETSGNNGRNHIKVCRTPGINFSTIMSDTSNELQLCFYIHAHGATCGGMSVYIDDASTSSDSQATLLKNLECRTITTPSNPTTKVKEYTSGGKTTGATSVGEHTFTRVASTGATQDWAKITINLNSYRAVDESFYIYFVSSANTGTNTTHNTDRLETGETAAATSSFKGDFAIDQIYFEEIAPSDFGKALNQEGTSATNMTEVNLSTVPS